MINGKNTSSKNTSSEICVISGLKGVKIGKIYIKTDR